MNANLEAALDKARGIELDEFEAPVLLFAVAFFMGLIVYVVGWRAPIKDYENLLSWFVGAVVALLGLYVAATRVKRGARKKAPKPAAPGGEAAV